MDSTSDGLLPGLPLICGEKILFLLNQDIAYICLSNGSISGKLLVTNYKLFFFGSFPNEKVAFLIALNLNLKNLIF